MSWPVVGGDEKVCKICVEINLLARVPTSDLQNMKQDINLYSEVIV
jgi:hypothetical protein